MSHWQAGKLNLACSLEVLRRALLKIMPDWEKYIESDRGAGLGIRNYYTKRDQEGFSLVVRGGSHYKTRGTVAPELGYADVGFKREADGTWSVQIDPMGLPRSIKDLEGAVTQEATHINFIGMAEAEGYGITKDEKEGDEVRIRLIVPVEDQYKLRA